MDLPTEFGPYLRHLLKAKKLTRAELARRLSLGSRPVSAPTVEHWITGRRQPPQIRSPYVDRIAAELELTADEKERLRQAQRWTLLQREARTLGYDDERVKALKAWAWQAGPPKASPPSSGQVVLASASLLTAGERWRLDLLQGQRAHNNVAFRQALTHYGAALESAPTATAKALIKAYAAHAWEWLNEHDQARQETAEALRLLGLSDLPPREDPDARELQLRLGGNQDARVAYGVVAMVNAHMDWHSRRFAAAIRCCHALEQVAARPPLPALLGAHAELRMLICFDQGTIVGRRLEDRRVPRDAELLELALVWADEAGAHYSASDEEWGLARITRYASYIHRLLNRPHRADELEQQAIEVYGQHRGVVSLLLDQLWLRSRFVNRKDALNRIWDIAVVIDSPHVLSDWRRTLGQALEDRSAWSDARNFYAVGIFDWPFSRDILDFQRLAEAFLNAGGTSASFRRLVEKYGWSEPIVVVGRRSEREDLFNDERLEGIREHLRALENRSAANR